jgi:hypothetical protein
LFERFCVALLSLTVQCRATFLSYHTLPVLCHQGNAAFGDKGRPASPGRPRIPPNAVVTFDVEMVGLPGKEPELIELIGDV